MGLETDEFVFLCLSVKSGRLAQGPKGSWAHQRKSPRMDTGDTQAEAGLLMQRIVEGGGLNKKGRARVSGCQAYGGVCGRSVVRPGGWTIIKPIPPLGGGVLGLDGQTGDFVLHGLQELQVSNHSINVSGPGCNFFLSTPKPSFSATRFPNS
jgi:hypothetical protein